MVKKLETSLTTKGLYNKKPITIICNKHQNVKMVEVLTDGERNGYINLQLSSLAYEIWLKNRFTPAYCPELDSIELFYLALKEFFDKEPEIEVKGNIDLEGSPYEDNIDTSFDIIY